MQSTVRIEAPSGRNQDPSITTKRTLWAIGLVLLMFASFALGFRSSLRLRTSESTERRISHLRQKGDAPPEVQAAVLSSLRKFQEGYTRRDPNLIGPFMQDMFGDNRDILLLGTDPGEFIRGNGDVAEFIKHDWVFWGQLKIDVDDAIISSSGDVAWVSTIGELSSQGGRPIRFSAVLTQSNSAWHFRQMQFQYDDSSASASDVFRLNTYRKLLNLATHKLSGSR